MIRAKRVRWLGHIARMSENRHTNKILIRKEGGKQKRKIPKKKWLQAVKEDSRGEGVDNCMEEAPNRNKWSKIGKIIEVKGL